MGVGPIINHICDAWWDALEMLLWEMGQKLPEFFPVLGSVSLWPWGGVLAPLQFALDGWFCCALFLLAWLTSVLSPQISITLNAG